MNQLCNGNVAVDGLPSRADTHRPLGTPLVAVLGPHQLAVAQLAVAVSATEGNHVPVDGFVVGDFAPLSGSCPPRSPASCERSSTLAPAHAWTGTNMRRRGLQSPRAVAPCASRGWRCCPPGCGPDTRHRSADSRHPRPCRLLPSEGDELPTRMHRADPVQTFWTWRDSSCGTGSTSTQRGENQQPHWPIEEGEPESPAPASGHDLGRLREVCLFDQTVNAPQ